MVHLQAAERGSVSRSRFARQSTFGTGDSVWSPSVLRLTEPALRHLQYCSGWQRDAGGECQRDSCDRFE